MTFPKHSLQCGRLQSVLGQRHYDVQMIGGIVLHRGEIAEMRTGEGKTLVATLAVYLNALAGLGVHVATSMIIWLAAMPNGCHYSLLG